MDERRGPADDAWLASLAGRAIAGVDDARAVAEGRLMRDALLRWSPDVGAMAVDDPQRLARLLARARAEGLIPAATKARRSPRARGGWQRLRDAWRPVSRGWAVAASIVIVGAVGVFVGQVQRTSMQDEVVRSTPDSVTLLRARDPATLRAELVGALKREGIGATTYTRLGRLGLDAELPATVPASLRDVLARHRIPLPTDGVLKVEIETEQR